MPTLIIKSDIKKDDILDEIELHAISYEKIKEEKIFGDLETVIRIVEISSTALSMIASIMVIRAAKI